MEDYSLLHLLEIIDSDYHDRAVGSGAAGHSGVVFTAPLWHGKREIHVVRVLVGC
jgi:hypothetical protein